MTVAISELDLNNFEAIRRLVLDLSAQVAALEERLDKLTPQVARNTADQVDLMRWMREHDDAECAGCTESTG